MGRDLAHPISLEMAKNAADLLSRVNYLFGRLNISAKISSGYRPAEINTSIGGAAHSQHTICKALDVIDPYGKIGSLLVSRKELLVSSGLWLESPMYTRKNVNGQIIIWCHLDTKDRANRVFNP